MIKKLIVENGYNLIYDGLSYDKKLIYNNTLKEINLNDEKYIVGIDLANENSKDLSILCKAIEENNKYIIKEIIKLF
jgi:hypothetical protein